MGRGGWNNRKDPGPSRFKKGDTLVSLVDDGLEVLFTRYLFDGETKHFLLLRRLFRGEPGNQIKMLKTSPEGRRLWHTEAQAFAAEILEKEHHLRLQLSAVERKRADIERLKALAQSC
jgi:hypothetical protein